MKFLELVLGSTAAVIDFEDKNKKTLAFVFFWEYSPRRFRDFGDLTSLSCEGERPILLWACFLTFAFELVTSV
jgi:hypothetical protein